MGDEIKHPTKSVVTTSAGTDFAAFEAMVGTVLDGYGLPSHEVFVQPGQRRAMVSNVPNALVNLQSVERARSFYISKMVAAASVGLFDAALNYLWDEVVNELRRRVVQFDLTYFFDIAAGTSSELRKTLSSEDDLTKLGDQQLLVAANKVGLLTDVGFQRLDMVRYMRNHASAAHPNQVELTGLDLANWLEVCVNEVIAAPFDKIAADTSRLLANIKKERLDDGAVAAAAAFFHELPREKAGNLAKGLYGLYTNADREPLVADNVRTLWPKLWTYIEEETRQGFGVRHARASASAETSVATAARELLDLVDGAGYLNNTLRAAELSAALDKLMATHEGWDNFSSELAPAREVAALAGGKGQIPEQVRDQYIRTLVCTFLGNRHGVAWAAAEVYESLLRALDGPSAARILRSFMDPDVASRLGSKVGQGQWEELLDIVEPKLTAPVDRELLAAVRDFPGTPDKLRVDSKISKLARSLP